MDFAAWSAAMAEYTETALVRALPPADIVPARLHEAMRYAVLGGGKRIRPLLVYAAGEVGGEPSAAARVALDAAACAVECIHAYSLVHDDMPCMDDDDLRRGRPTLHRAYDEATALLVGDALQTAAFEILATDAVDATGSALALCRELAAASGSRGMAGGQAIDLASVGVTLDLPALETMHRMKTGALLRAAVRMGLIARGLPATRLDDYAAAIGLAFQVVDDVLDATASTAALGKTAGKDGAANKPTYVSLLGLDASRRLAAELAARAHAALDGLDGTRRLRELADRIVMREN